MTYFCFLQRIELDSQNSRAVGQLDVLQDSLEGWRVGGCRLQRCWRRRSLSDGAHCLGCRHFGRRFATKVEHGRVQVRAERDGLAEVLGSVDANFHQGDVAHHLDQVPVAVVQSSSTHGVTLGGVQVDVNRQLALVQLRPNHLKQVIQKNC